MYMTKRTKWFGFVFVIPFLISFLIFWLTPLLYGIWISLHDFRLSVGNNGFIGLQNYVAILTPTTLYHDVFMNTLKNTLLFIALSVPPLVLISLGLALLIDHLPNRLKTFFRTVFFLSYAISVTAVSALYLWLFGANGGFINNILLKTGLISSAINWTGDQPYAWFVIVVATVWWTVGFNMLLFVNALDEVDVNLYEAADLDGASAWNKFRYITLPDIRNISIFVMITTVIASFNLYGQSLLITRGGPGQSTSSLIMGIHATVFGNNQLGIGSAMALLMGIIMMLITGLQYWASYRNKREETGQRREPKQRLKRALNAGPTNVSQQPATTVEKKERKIT
ncbi:MULTISPECIES: carbohydrate ABC transporter permease [Exiguobacterium]|uniref:carbohydrate ABC transporter permease n=1 Tax=Exiguobacterium TaxID=33986 RepID=UPI001BE605D5|nr:MULTISPECIES: sugar ABC transporter permease [Exiguobacterium]MCT4781637.1 sugar ABC transporter permease [Exiguobacterium himgiriensis]